MSDSMTVCDHQVSIRIFDFGGAVGLPQPHLQVDIVEPNGKMASPSFKLPRNLKLGGMIRTIDSTRFKIEKQIGGGNFGKVFKGKSETGLPVAIKIPTKRRGRLIEGIGTTIIEGAIMNLVSNPNIIRMVCFALNETDLPWIVLEFAQNGSLYRTLELVYKHQQDEECLPEYWTEETKLKISYGIICGLNYLHSHQCVHRDLTARNVLLMEDYEPKLCDFGLTSFLQGGGVIILGEGDERRTAYSLQYCAPEVFPWFKIVPEARPMLPRNFDWTQFSYPPSDDVEESDEDEPRSSSSQNEIVIKPSGIYDFKSDVWAYGVVLYQIWSDNTFVPYSATNEHPSVEEIKEVLLVRKQSPWEFKPLDKNKYPEICQIVKKTLKHNPKNRISVPQIKEKLKLEIDKFQSSTS